jgi:hypothetical protein
MQPWNIRKETLRVLPNSQEINIKEERKRQVAR